MVQRSLASLLKKVEEDLDAVRTEFLRNVAYDLIISSPVDTGTYVKNHSITTSSGSGGTTSSHGKSKDDGTARVVALENLNAQILGLPKDASKVYIANRSPHAAIVEYKHGYNVYGSVKNRSQNHLQDAVNKVKARS